MTPCTSNQELVAFFTGLGLELEFQPDAAGDFEAVLEVMLAHYEDTTRAQHARVFVLRDDALDASALTLLTNALGKPLPALEGEALLRYVADSLFIAAHHPATAANALCLVMLEESAGALYLLRSDAECAAVRSHGLLSSLHSPDTEAALQGVYRTEGCSTAFAEHAVRCAQCLTALEACELKYSLPEGFEAFRRHPVRPPLPSPPSLPAVSGVGIVIPQRKPWWKFWAPH